MHIRTLRVLRTAHQKSPISEDDASTYWSVVRKSAALSSYRKSAALP
jgi:hypothetical protein